jgi:hypothetical protein
MNPLNPSGPIFSNLLLPFHFLEPAPTGDSQKAKKPTLSKKTQNASNVLKLCWIEDSINSFWLILSKRKATLRSCRYLRNGRKKTISWSLVSSLVTRSIRNAFSNRRSEIKEWLKYNNEKPLVLKSRQSSKEISLSLLSQVSVKS